MPDRSSGVGAPEAILDDPVSIRLRADGGLLARNSLYNLAGQAAPLLVALVAFPVLLDALGKELFGVLGIAWMVLGYFSLFDLGVSRALTQVLSEKLAARAEADVPALIWTACTLMLAMGVVGSALMAVLSPWLVGDVLEGIPASATADVLRTFYLLAASVPLVISTASLRGILEAAQRFDVINAIRVPMGVLTFAGPLMILPFDASLSAMVAVLVCVRVAAWVAHAAYCFKLFPAVRNGFGFDRALATRLLRFGGWMTVSNVVSPLMVYMDRFLIGAFISVAAVTYYVTPWEVVTKLLIVPGAIAGVLFPAFSYWSYRDPDRMERLYTIGLKATVLSLFPLILLLTAGAEPLLRLWLNEDMAQHSALPLQILALGVLLNGAAGLPFALLQGAGRPDITAKLHLIELPIYAGVLWFLLDRFGIPGVAAAWLFRVAVDFVLLLVLSSPLVRRERAGFRRALAGTAVAVLLVGATMLPMEQSTRLAVCLFGLLGYGIFTWTNVLSLAEKAVLWNRFSRYLRWT